MDEVVESDPGEVLRSFVFPRSRSFMIAPRLVGSRSDEGVSGAVFELAGDRSRFWSALLTMDGHRDRSLGRDDPAVRMIAASMTATC
jgi:hypothetical protein